MAVRQSTQLVVSPPQALQPAAQAHTEAKPVLAPGAVLPLDPDYDERAVFIASGEIDIAGETFTAGRLLVFRPGDRISILAVSQARLMLLGGEPMDGPRHIWWNFVSTRQDRIVQAAQQWEAQSMGQIPGEQEWIPLPAHRFRDTGGG